MIITTAISTDTLLFKNSLEMTGFNGELKIIRQMGLVRGGNIAAARYIEYEKILKNKDELGQVILTDSRDVIFQKNPEDSMPDWGLHFYQEDEEMTIGEEDYNRAWILRAYGEEVLNELKDQPIICAGIIAGGLIEISWYNRLLMEEIRRLPDFIGVDQAAHNYLIRKKKIGIVHDNYDEVFTMCLVDQKKYMVENGIIKHKKGVPCMVHQYDRNPILFKAITDHYKGGNKGDNI